jgi:hypothetical protein
VVVRASSRRLSPRGRRVWLGVLAASALAGALVLTRSLLPVEATLDEKDFVQEYLLARAILDRVDPYQPIDVLGARYGQFNGFFQKTHPTPHPPTVGLLALPLGLMSYGTAVRVWFGLELTCLVASVVLLIRGAGLPLWLRNAPLLAVALIAWPPVSLDLLLGQLMPLVLLGLAAAWLALLMGRSSLGGGLLGLTLLIKPIAWPWLIVLAWRRDWRSLGAASVVVAAGGALSIAAIGLAATTNYVTNVLPMMSPAFLDEPTNMSLWTVAPRLGSTALSGILPAAALLVAVWWACRRIPLAASLAMMTVASLLVSPILWYFYLVTALLPMAYVIAVLWRRGLPLAELVAALGVFGLLSVSQYQLTQLGDGGAGAAIMLEPTVALVLLGGLLAWVSQGEPRTSVARSTL